MSTTHLPRGRTARRRVDIGSWKATAAVLFLLLAFSTSHMLLTRKRLSVLQGQAIKFQDSLRIAREYGTLAVETFDLQQELDLRNVGSIPVERSDIRPPAGAPPGLRPVPQFTVATDDSTERAQASAILRGESNHPERARLQITYTQPDIREAGVAAVLQRLGFRPNYQSSNIPGPSNAITFGDSVPLTQVRVIAYALIEGGMDVKRIRRFEESSGKDRVLEITQVRHAVDWPPLTVFQIGRLTTNF